MDNEVKEYVSALNTHRQAQISKMKADVEIRASRFRLLQARENLRNREIELLQDDELKAYEAN